MDGQTLSNIFDQGQFSLVKPGMDTFNLDKQKQQADLASLMGQEKRAQAMHPVEMESKAAYAAQARAQANTMEDNLKVLQGVPLDQRIAEKIALNKNALKGEALKAADIEMEELGGLAAAAMKNGGILPLEVLQKYPQHAQYFKDPKGAMLAAQIAKAYWMAKPKELSKEADDLRAQQLARIQAQSRIDVKNAPGAAGSKPNKMTLEQYLTSLNAAIMVEKDPVRKQALQDEADRTEVQLLRMKREAVKARQEGEVDVAAAGGVPVNPERPPTATPRTGNNPTVAPSAGSAAQNRTVKMKTKDGKVFDVPAAQVQAAKARGWTE